MSLNELPSAIRALERADKLRLIQLLADDVAREETVQLDMADQTVSLWSPHDAVEGAAALLRVLDEDKVAP